MHVQLDAFCLSLNQPPNYVCVNSEDYENKPVNVPTQISPIFTMFMCKPGPEVIKLFSFSTQLSAKFQLLIKAKLPTNEEVSCFKSLRHCIYHAKKC